MTMKTRSARAIYPAIALIALAACQQEPRSAQWYMSHGVELESKVKACNADPKLKETDQECKNAIEAFVTLVQATSKPPAAQ